MPERGVLAKTSVGKPSAKREVGSSGTRIHDWHPSPPKIPGIKSGGVGKHRCKATYQKTIQVKNQYYVRLYLSRPRTRRDRSPRLSSMHGLGRHWPSLDR